MKSGIVILSCLRIHCVHSVSDALPRFYSILFYSEANLSQGPDLKLGKVGMLVLRVSV